MILRVVQKFYVKARQVVCRRLKISNLSQKHSRDDALNSTKIVRF